MSSSSELLQAGLEALKQQRYAEAVHLLESFCRNVENSQSKEYAQAQMSLVKAYQQNGQLTQAIALCQQLTSHENLQVQTWGQQALSSLRSAQDKALAADPEITADPEPTFLRPLQSPVADSNPPPAANTVQPSPLKAGRAAAIGVKLGIAKFAGNLVMASTVTLSLLVGMLLVLFLGLVLITSSNNPAAGLGLAVMITVVFSLVMFFVSPWLMDLMQSWLYKTRWVPLSEVECHSPEAAAVIRRVCADRQLSQPRLGIIDDQNPTAFTYGSLPNTARLVVSQGLFTYLDDDEVATVYAHELGHIVHWDFAVMTLASTLVQIMYLIYIYARRVRNGKLKDGFQAAALAAYVFYIIGTYLMLYLSRVREYFADHFAAEVTGNPNALSRGLVKIAYGIVEESQKTAEPSRLVEGTRALGIYDHKAAAATGTAYRITAQPQQIGRVFLWDMFNPWGWWMELNSTHPLTGKRVRALSTYAEQLGLPTEFDMALVIREGRTLNKSRLYSNFVSDSLLYIAQWLGLGVGLILGLLVTATNAGDGKIVVSLALLGFGAGMLARTLIMFPNFNRAPESDVLTLMSDPYATPLRGQPVKLQGQLIGRGDAGYAFGSDLKLQDRTGMLFLRYSSRFGALGNFLFGASQVQNLIGLQVGAIGWFRRGIAPWMDLVRLNGEDGTVVNSYHRFWLLIIGGGAIVLGLILPIFD
jgi:Zn-dependent protease with chaperone function